MSVQASWTPLDRTLLKSCTCCFVPTSSTLDPTGPVYKLPSTLRIVSLYQAMMVDIGFSVCSLILFLPYEHPHIVCGSDSQKNLLAGSTYVVELDDGRWGLRFWSSERRQEATAAAGFRQRALARHAPGLKFLLSNVKNRRKCPESIWQEAHWWLSKLWSLCGYLI